MFCMLDFRECRAMKNGDCKVHLNYPFLLCLRASCSQCHLLCFGQFMWENFCAYIALLRFSSWNFHIAIICLVQQSHRRYFVDVSLQDNYAAGAAHLGQALRCIYNVLIWAKTFVPFHKLGIFLWCTSVSEERSKGRRSWTHGLKTCGFQKLQKDLISVMLVDTENRTKANVSWPSVFIQLYNSNFIPPEGAINFRYFVELVTKR